MQNTVITPVATQATASVLGQANATAAPVAVPSAEKANQAFEGIRICIEQIALEREGWENNQYRVSNDYLYAILQKCYGLYKSLEGPTAQAKALRQALNDYANVKGYNFRDSTHTINKIVRCVFGASDESVAKQRISHYSTALRAALGANIPVADLPVYIANAGGVEALRGRTSGKKPMSAKDKALVAAKSIEVESLGNVKHDTLGQIFEAGKADQHVVVIGTWLSDGSINLRAVVQGKGVVNAALASYHSGKKAERAKQEAEAEQAAVKKAANDAVNAAAANAFLTLPLAA